MTQLWGNLLLVAPHNQSSSLAAVRQELSGDEGDPLAIPPIWFGLAFLRTRLPCSDPTTDDKNSRVELVVGT